MVLQTKEYAESVRILEREPIFVYFNHNGRVVSQLLMFKMSKYEGLIKKKLHTKRASHILSKVSRDLKPYYRWFYGPVIIEDGYKDEIYRKLGSFLLENHIQFIGSIHPLETQQTPLENFGFKRKTWGTFLIDLRLGKEKLWHVLDKKSARKNVERAKERGVTILEIKDDNDLKIYTDLINENRQMLNLDRYYYEEVLQSWKPFKNVGRGFLAWKGEKPLAGISISTFNNYIYEWSIGRSKYDIENNLYSQDLLKWHIIEWGHDNGYRYYDLAGVNPNPTDQKELGIYRYKQKWGGKFTNLLIYSS